MEYRSQEQAIASKAQEMGILQEKIDAYFDKKLDEVAALHPTHARQWQLGRAEFMVWEHFFDGSPFPGKLETRPENDRAEREVRSRSSEYVYESKGEWLLAKAIDKGILKEYVARLEELKKEVVRKYPDRDLNNWRLWKTHSWLWVEFFGGHQPFPAKEPRHGRESRTALSSSPGNALMKLSQTMREPARLSFESSDNCPSKQSQTIRESARPIIGSSGNYLSKSVRITEQYVPQMKLINSTAVAHGCIDVVSQYYKTELQDTSDRYPDESSDWQNWHTESLEAREGEFPGKEPPRRYPLCSETLPLRFLPPPRPLPPSRPSAMQHQENIQPSVTPSVTYHTQERLMETMAKKRGFRREFFQLLQKKRDEARAQHPHCSSEFRRWFADKAVWDYFFKDVSFVGNEPRQDQACKSASKLDPKPVSKPPEVPPKLPPHTKTMADPPQQGIVIINRMFLIAPPRIKALCKYFFDDIPGHKLAEERIGCRFFLGDTVDGKKLLLTYPLPNNWRASYNEPEEAEEALALKRGNEFLKSWATHFFCEGGPITISNYWNGLSDFERKKFEISAVKVHIKSDAAPALLLVNGKFLRCTARDLKKLNELFLQDKEGQEKCQDQLGCEFKLTSPSKSYDTIILEAQFLGSCGRLNNGGYFSDRYNKSVPTTELTKSVLVGKGDELLEKWARFLLQNSDNMSVTLARFWIDLKPSERDDLLCASGLAINEACEYFWPYSKTDSNNLCSSLIMSEGSLEHFADALGCTLTATHQSRYIYKITINGLGDSLMRNDILYFFARWAEQVVSENAPIKISQFWKDYPQHYPIASATSKFYRYMENINRSIQSTLASSAQQSHKPIGNNPVEEGIFPVVEADSKHEKLPFQDPDVLWETYAQAFKATEVDRLLIEESAKAQGTMRMVQDEYTGDIVTVKELTRRTMSRVLDGSLSFGTGRGLMGTMPGEEMETHITNSPTTSLPIKIDYTDRTHDLEDEGLEEAYENHGKGQAEKSIRETTQPPQPDQSVKMKLAEELGGGVKRKVAEGEEFGQVREQKKQRFEIDGL